VREIRNKDCFGICVECDNEVPVPTLYLPKGDSTIIIVCPKCAGTEGSRKKWKMKKLVGDKNEEDN
jgi:hypothetical protein